MIRSLTGVIASWEDERLVLLVGGVGYEVLVPPIVGEGLRAQRASKNLSTALAVNGQTGEPATVTMYISFHQSERQPKPVLVGFLNDIEREFYEALITVEDIGPTAALRALVMPVREIARAIEERDPTTLRKLPGIGDRKAEKMIATLHGKVGKFALMPETGRMAKAPLDVRSEVLEVLVRQLGYRPKEAEALVNGALERNKSIHTAEALFEELYRTAEPAAAGAAK